MADTPHITTGVTGEPPCETPASRAFPGLLIALHALIIAEIEYGEVGYSGDPAYQDWQRDAELAHEQLTTCLRDFHSLPCAIPEDRPLRRMAWLIDEMLGHEEPGGARRLCREMLLNFFREFDLYGFGPTTLHRSGLLAQARHLVVALAHLPLFDGSPEFADEASPGPELIATL